MRDFSLRQMRREYARESKRIKTLLLSAFAAAVIFFWIVYIQKGEHTAADVWLFAWLPVAVCGLVAGLFLVLTGESWLLRRTPYGRALSRLGDAREIARRIDKEAEKAEPHDALLLLEHYLILFVPYRPRKGAAFLAARPYPADRIDRVVFSRSGRDAINLTVYALGEAEQVTLRDLEQMRAAVEWINTQEIASTWSN